MTGVLKAVLAFLMLPAMLYLVNMFRDYAFENMVLNSHEQVFMKALPYIVCFLYVVGIFKAIGRMNRGD